MNIGRTGSILIKMDKTLSHFERIVLLIIFKLGEPSIYEIIKEYGMVIKKTSRSNLYKKMEKCVKRKYLIKKKEYNKNYYSLTEKGEDQIDNGRIREVEKRINQKAKLKAEYLKRKKEEEKEDSELMALIKAAVRGRDV